MATEIVRWCDVHMSRDERVSGSEVRVSLGGHPPKSLDLCPVCRDEIIKPLEALLDEYGATVPTTAPQATRGRAKAVPAAALPLGVVPASTDPERPHRCLWCPATFTTGEGMFGHAAKKHGTPKSALEIWGNVCPVCGITFPKSPGQHIGAQHRDYGIMSPSQAFLWAAENGDPHGAYAAVFAKGHA